MYPVDKKHSIIIIGAGPIGIEAALYGKICGYDVLILEKEQIAHNLHQWQHITFFSPFKFNHSLPGKKLIEKSGKKLPSDQQYLTGKKYLTSYLKPIANSNFLKKHIIPRSKVLAIGRTDILKGEYIGNIERSRFPFKILVRNSLKQETFYYSDYLIDASGNYDNPNWMGEGGIPAIGELANQKRIEYRLADIANTQKSKYIGQKTLLVGDGHSAANTMTSFSSLFSEDPNTQVIWATRNDGTQPVMEVPNDPLEERARIVRQANHLATHPNVKRIKAAFISALTYNPDSQNFTVELLLNRNKQTITIDHIISNTGYAPDNHIYQELQVHECYASRGPMKLAATLLGESSADCLEQTSKGADVLKNPEPNFYTLGIKSYGKNSNFLLKIGFEQIRDVYRLISGNQHLDLYNDSDLSGINFE